jgi:hypothetical protein
MKKAKIFLIGLFVVFIFSAAIQSIHPLIKAKVVNENRVKAAWPSENLLAGLSNGSSYAITVEKYFSDHFSLRDFMLRCLGQFEYSVLGRAREVIIGRDGWLSDKKVLSETLHQLDRADDEQIKASVLQIKRFQYWLQERDVEFLMVIVPMKPTIYPEEFPKWYVERPENTGFKRFQSALERNDVPSLDVAKLFRRHKNDAQLYYKTDMHWSPAGAAYTAEGIINYFSEKDLGGKIWREKFSTENASMSGGELITMPLLYPSPEQFLQKTSLDEGHILRTIDNVTIYTGIDKNRALLPPSLMFGNSFALLYPRLGFHAYFKESSLVLDYESFSKVLDYVKPEYKIFILHVYETQLQFHLMPPGRKGYWTNFDNYWDSRIKDLPLPRNFVYRP